MGKVYGLMNAQLKILVSDHGAELKSLKKEGKELMWQADPAFWGRTSPVLFPLVGNYWEKKSRFNGKEYEMSQHGFARDMEFKLLKETDDTLVFELKDSEESKKKYPCPFVLQIGYVLKPSGVEVKWLVKNPGDEDIFFSIGGHPAFNCDLSRGSLGFKKNGEPVSGSLKANIIEGDGSGCLSDRTKEYELSGSTSGDGKAAADGILGQNAGVLKMSPSMFDEDALIIEDRQADEVLLYDEAGAAVLSVKFDAPLFGLWSPAGKNAPFVCIEPWYGRCDKVGFSGELSAREYGNSLKPGEVFEVSYNIEVF